MSSELVLVTQLAIILIAAGVFTVICRALKQPLILGYIIAGFIVGPHLGLFPQLDAASVKNWSDLGIIFLLFGLGLEFSFRKLIKIGSSALTVSGIICIGMFAVGFTLGESLGWTEMESIFMGGMMGMSSTTIIIKSYTDMGLKEKPWSSLIFGTLVFEDLIAVLLMVLLSTLAVTGKFSGKEMFMGIVNLFFFLILWFAVGIFLIPLLLKKAKKYLDDEILLLVGTGLCFTMVVFANFVGFSSALGAFVMGSILSETLEGERIAKITHSIKDLFGAIFFVSVGMMVDPVIIANNWVQILIITVVALSGLLVFSTGGALLAGAGLDNAVHVGFSMAQLGEFSFIIAGLGCSLNVMSESIYPMIIAVSVITTFTTPYMIKAGDPVSRFLQRKLPEKILVRLAPKDASRHSSKAEKSEWKTILTATAIRVVVYSVSIIALQLVSKLYFAKVLLFFLPGISETAIVWLTFGVTLFAVSPLLVGLITNSAKTRQSMITLLKKDRDNRWPILAISIIRAALAVVFIMVMVATAFDPYWWVQILLAVALLVLFLFITEISYRSISRLERTFMSNLNAKEEQERRQAPVTAMFNAAFEDSPINTKVITISPEFLLAGEEIGSLPREKSRKSNIVKITRGSRSISIPSAKDRIFPGDRLLVAGTDAQIAAFEEMIASNTAAPAQNPADENFALEAITLREGHKFCGVKLGDTGVRKSGCMIICVRRDDKEVANPGSDFVFAEGDVVWIAGEKDSIDWFK